MLDKRLLALLGKDKKYIVWMVICNLLTTVCNAAIAFCLCGAIDLALKGSALSEYLTVLLAAAGAAALRFLLILMNGSYGARLGSNAKETLRRRIYEKTARLGTCTTDGLSLASLTQVSIEGVEQLDLYYSTYIPQFFYSMISPFLLFALFMFISVPSAVILICCVPLIPASIIAVSRYAKKIFDKYWGQYTKMGDAFLDTISGMKELKIYGTDGRDHDHMNSEAEEFRKITMKVLTMQLASTTIMDLVAYGGAGLGIGIAAASNGSIHSLFGLSMPAALLFIVLSAVDFFLPLRALGSAFHVSMNGATAGKKILALLDTPEPEWGKEEIGKKDIALKDVVFSYDGQRIVLDHVSMEAPSGSLTAIVGRSGCGKSTVVSLLSGLRQVKSGSVTVGGTELKKLSRDSFYQHAGVVSCNTHLFTDTVRNNFRIAKPDITDTEIMQALKNVDMDAFIAQAGGPDLELREDTVNLSGGQRQRLALAVALSADKDIYFFDEVTSNIDAESEDIIMKNIYGLSREKTVVMISHRLKNVVKADRIYVLDGGKVVQLGDHQQLMAENGVYQALYNEQKALEEGKIK
ncbi:MAG: ABC transporter ATP-binding protein/permease [Clostridia bacterium]|nr:ABC transporter ATP-binding protein/permease [Clostridia bacterium]